MLKIKFTIITKDEGSANVKYLLLIKHDFENILPNDNGND